MNARVGRGEGERCIILKTTMVSNEKHTTAFTSFPRPSVVSCLRSAHQNIVDGDMNELRHARASGAGEGGVEKCVVVFVVRKRGGWEGGCGACVAYGGNAKQRTTVTFHRFDLRDT